MLLDHRLDIVGYVVGSDRESIRRGTGQLPVLRGGGMRSAQSSCQHSHRKPVSSARPLTHSARRSLRLRDQDSLCAMRSSRDPNGGWKGSVKGFRLAEGRG